MSLRVDYRSDEILKFADELWPRLFEKKITFDVDYNLKGFTIWIGDFWVCPKCNHIRMRDTDYNDTGGYHTCHSKAWYRKGTLSDI